MLYQKTQLQLTNSNASKPIETRITLNQFQEWISVNRRKNIFVFRNQPNLFCKRSIFTHYNRSFKYRILYSRY